MSRLARLLAPAAALLFAVAATSCSTAPKTPKALPTGHHIGEPMAVAETFPLAKLATDPASHFEKTLLVEATITNVCQTRGCWMAVEDAGATTMVRWDGGCGGAYTFPKDAVGKRVLIQGILHPKQLTPEAIAHYEGESAGKPIPKQGYEINTSGVILLDG